MKSPAAYAHVDILLIEDDPSIGVMYKLQLEHGGHRVRLVADAQAALAQALLALPDLILLDLRLPEEDGLSLLARLREQPSLRYVPVVMLSNYADADLLDRAAALGVCEWVLKSATPPSVISAEAAGWARAGVPPRPGGVSVTA